MVTIGAGIPADTHKIRKILGTAEYRPGTIGYHLSTNFKKFGIAGYRVPAR